LVPRSSGTPVATWAWPTWIVSRRRVLEAVFILLEFPSPSRRIFISSHSLPPLLFAVSVLQNRSPTRVGGGARALCSCRASWLTYQSEIEGDRARGRLLVRGGDLSWGSLLWGTGRTCSQLAEDWMSCQCGS
jgi:hypothetical protein